MVENFDDQGLRTWRLTVGDSSLQIVPERGALITSWIRQGEELLYMDRTTLLDKTKNVRGGVPLLFPLCGPVRDGHYRIKDQTYALGQHGLARQSAFDVIASGDNFIELGLRSTPATRATYPFDFELLCRYRLEGGKLRLEQEIVNHGAEPMPFQVGYHPYFLVGPDKLIDWRIPAKEYRDNETPARSLQGFGGSIDLQAGVVDWELTATAQEAGFTDRQRELSITMGYGTEFRYVVVWSVPGKPFACLEPWSSPRFGMNDDVAILRAGPGETVKTQVWFEGHKKSPGS